MHCLELYFKITSYAYTYSTWIASADTQPPWQRSQTEDWAGFIHLAKDLFQDGRYEEAQRFNRLLFQVLHWDTSQTVINTILSTYVTRLNETPSADLLTRDAIQLALCDAVVASGATQLSLHASENLRAQIPSSLAAKEAVFNILDELQKMTSQLDVSQAARQTVESELLKLVSKESQSPTLPITSLLDELERIEQNCILHDDISTAISCVRLQLRYAPSSRAGQRLASIQYVRHDRLAAADAVMGELVSHLQNRTFLNSRSKSEVSELLKETALYTLELESFQVPRLRYDQARIQSLQELLESRESQRKLTRSDWLTAGMSTEIPHGWTSSWAGELSSFSEEEPDPIPEEKTGSSIVSHSRTRSQRQQDFERLELRGSMLTEAAESAQDVDPRPNQTPKEDLSLIGYQWEDEVSEERTDTTGAATSSGASDIAVKQSSHSQYTSATIPLSKLSRRFVNIRPGDYEECKVFIKNYPDILQEREKYFLDTAVEAIRDGHPVDARHLVHQVLILRRCRELGSGPFLGNLIIEDYETVAAFTADIETVYDVLRSEAQRPRLPDPVPVERSVTPTRSSYCPPPATKASFTDTALQKKLSARPSKLPWLS